MIQMGGVALYSLAHNSSNKEGKVSTRILYRQSLLCRQQRRALRVVARWQRRYVLSKEHFQAQLFRKFPYLPDMSQLYDPTHDCLNLNWCSLQDSMQTGQ
jgi:hypothetical protein